MRVFVLLNHTAKSDEHVPEDQGRRNVEDAFARRGISAIIKSVKGSEIAKEVQSYLTNQSADPSKKYDVLVVGGGDGTIGAAAGELVGKSEPFGILPLGTLNHFAKDLGIPVELDLAVDVILRGKSRRVDAGELNGQIFVNNSSVGLYPFMVANRIAEQRRWGIGKLAASIPAVVRTLWKGTWRRFTIRFANRELTLRSPCVFVGNNSYDLSLGRFGSRHSLDQGELCVFVVKKQTRLALLLLPFRVALNLTDRTRDIDVFKMDAVEITSRSGLLQVSLDGEVRTIETPLRYAIKKGALCVLVPDAIEHVD